jgi:hypothetical protein
MKRGENCRKKKMWQNAGEGRKGGRGGVVTCKNSPAGERQESPVGDLKIKLK